MNFSDTEPRDEPDPSAQRRQAITAEVTELELDLYRSLDGAAARLSALHAEALALGDVDLADRCELARSDALSRGGEIVEARRIQELVLADARARGRTLLEARSQCLLASTCYRLGLLVQGQEAAGECVRLLDDTAPANWQVEHYLVLATFSTYARAGRANFEIFEDVLRRARARAEPILLLATLNNYVWNAKDGPAAKGRVDALADELDELIAQHPELASVPILDTLAVVRLQQGQLEQAEDLITRALAHANRVEPDELAALNHHLATVRRRQGRSAEATRLLKLARASALEAETPEWAVASLRDLAEIDAENGDFASAYRRLHRYVEEQAAGERVESQRRSDLLQTVYGTEVERDQRVLYQELALRDPLTDVYNRRYLEHQLPQLIAAGVLSVAMIDVDHFKRINDHHSHDVGDEVLRQLAELLRRHARVLSNSGTVVRLGGEEFLSLAPGVEAGAAAVAFEQLRRRIERHAWDVIPAGIQPTISIGLITNEDPSVSSSAILRAADELLMRAKRAGRNRLLHSGPAPARSGAPAGSAALDLGSADDVLGAV